MCVSVCVSVTTITRNCVHRSSLNWSLGEGSDHLELIKFWPSRAPGKGVCGEAKFFGSFTTASAQCLRLSERFFPLSFGLTVDGSENEANQGRLQKGKWTQLASKLG